MPINFQINLAIESIVQLTSDTVQIVMGNGIYQIFHYFAYPGGFENQILLFEYEFVTRVSHSNINISTDLDRVIYIQTDFHKKDAFSRSKLTYKEKKEWMIQFMRITEKKKNY